MPVFGAGRALYFVGEGGKRGFQQRFRGLTRDLSPDERRRCLSWFGDAGEVLHLDRHEDARFARDQINRHRADLAVFDSFANFHGLDENSTSDMALVGSRIKWLRDETGETFPEKVTAFHPEMGAHGKFGEPCPQCGDPIQRIVYAGRETNYCPSCQTGGKLLADRALSRLLKGEWPRTIEELEDLRASHREEDG